MRGTSPERTQDVLGLVFEERQKQELRYGEENLTTQSGSGPNCCWLLPYTGNDATEIQKELRSDYEDFEEEGLVTWVHLVREEVAEAFMESDPQRLAEELIQVAALCVSWVERLPIEIPLLSDDLTSPPPS